MDKERQDKRGPMGEVSRWLGEYRVQSRNNFKASRTQAVLWNQTSAYIASWGFVSFAFALLIGLGVGIMSVSPPEFFVARVCFVSAALILGAKICHWIASSKASRLERMIYSFLIFGAIGVASTEAWRWVNRRQLTTQSALMANELKGQSLPETIPPTIHDLFKQDFPNVLKISRDKILTSPDDPHKIKVEFQGHYDDHANAKFMSVYVPKCHSTYTLCSALPNLLPIIFQEIQGAVAVTSLYPGDSSQRNTINLPFTGQVYVYYEDNLTLQELGSLEGEFKQKNLVSQFRGQNYATTKWFQRELETKQH